MRRVLFQWRGLTIHAYPALLYLGLVCGVLGGAYAGALRGLDPARACAAMLLLVPAALVGARLLFVASHWHVYSHEPRRIWRRSEGGAAMYGGLVLSFLLSLPLLAGLGLPVGAFWDAATVAILIGMVFTRIGCLLNGCCAGRPAQGPLALYLPNVHGVWRRRLPTQLLEASLAVVLLLGSVLVWGRLPFGGALFLCNLAAYGAGRWGLEPTREDCDTVGGVRLHRALSAGLVAVGVGGFLFLWLLGPGLIQAPEAEVGPRMSAWSFWLAPMAVLAVLALFRFVGCHLIGGAGDLEFVDDPSGKPDYAATVKSDSPVGYWRLGDKNPAPSQSPHGLTATNEVPGSPNGIYHDPSGSGADLVLGVTPGLLLEDPNASAISVEGGFVKVEGAAAFIPGEFTLEVLASPEWDLKIPPKSFRTLLACLSKQANAGVVIYAGPIDPTDEQSEYYWQVWVGNGTAPERLELKDFVPNGKGGLKYDGNDPVRKNPTAQFPEGDPGPIVAEGQPTYLVVTREGDDFVLYFYYPDWNWDWLRYPLKKPTSYTPSDPQTELLIGIVNNPDFGTVPGANEFLFPFWGKIQEVAVYDYPVAPGRLFSHGFAAFNL